MWVGLRELNNLPMITQLINGRAMAQIHVQIMLDPFCDHYTICCVSSQVMYHLIWIILEDRGAGEDGIANPDVPFPIFSVAT